MDFQHSPRSIEVQGAVRGAGSPYEFVLVNDNSKDETENILQRLQKTIPSLRYINNRPPNGVGFAVRAGLANFSGDGVAVLDEVRDFYLENVRNLGLLGG